MASRLKVQTTQARLRVQDSGAVRFGAETGIPIYPGLYDGAYEVTPRAHNEVILATKNKMMAEDVTVRKVPYYETSNLFDGKTAYIAEEI